MTNKEFKYWLSGYFNLSDELFLTINQINIIQNHANLVTTVETLDTDIGYFLNFLKQEISFNNKVCCTKAKLKFVKSTTLEPC